MPPPPVAVREVYRLVLLKLPDAVQTQNVSEQPALAVACTAVSSCAASAEQDRGACGLSRTRGRHDTQKAPENMTTRGKHGRAGSV